MGGETRAQISGRPLIALKGGLQILVALKNQCERKRRENSFYFIFVCFVYLFFWLFARACVVRDTNTFSKETCEIFLFILDLELVM